jgi:hypothetical protein
VSVELVPLTRAEARLFVAAHHRHSDAPLGDVFRVGLELDGELVGVAIAGRPAARLLDDGRTLEVTRVALVDGVENGCSRLYGAACRAAFALGYRRVVTYTLEHERASSVRAAGFVFDADVEHRDSWARPKRPRQDLNLFGERTRDVGPKRRWLRELGGASGETASRRDPVTSWDAASTSRDALIAGPAAADTDAYTAPDVELEVLE